MRKKSQRQSVEFHWPKEEITDEFVNEFGIDIGDKELYRALLLYNIGGVTNFW